jgi:hypothetical protein
MFEQLRNNYREREATVRPVRIGKGGANRLFWQWVVATAAGWFVIHSLAFSSLFWAGLSVLGVAQWAVLRNRITRAGWWVVVTPLGLLVGISLGGILGGLLQDAMDGIRYSPLGISSGVPPGRSVAAFFTAHGLSGAVIGALLGASQWFVLRAQARHGVFWLLVYLGSGAFAALLAALLSETALPPSVIHGIAALTVGVATAVAVVRCLQSSTDPPRNEAQRVAHNPAVHTDAAR